MAKNEKKRFEDCSEIIDLAIQRQRNKWQLDAISWLDYEDVAQIIRLHIYNKWDMWDQSRPLEPWISRIIYHQIRNLIRNLYGNYTKPCLQCEFAVGEDGCNITASKSQCNQCVLYRKWAKRKKSGLNLKVPVSTENHQHEISSRPDSEVNYDASLQKLNDKMREELSEQHFTAYLMLFFEKATEEDVAKFMGYKTSPAKRKAGYRQVKNLKKMFKTRVMEILKSEDIIVNDAD
jgi:DNA-directed RNA polymerase specialized sigma24 family protein